MSFYKIYLNNKFESIDKIDLLSSPKQKFQTSPLYPFQFIKNEGNPYKEVCRFRCRLSLYSICLAGLSMATRPKRSTLWRSICIILRWSKGKVTVDRSSLMWNRIVPSSCCLMLLNARVCAHDSTGSLNWNRLLCTQLYKLIGWMCVFVCMCAWKHTGRLWIFCWSNHC